MNTKLTALKNSLLAQINKNDVVANNLANVNTIGFKKNDVFFEILKHNVGSTDLQVKTDFSQGSLKETNNPFDLAISGRGFFVVETEEGEAYTRDGHFKLGEDGFLRNSSGNPLLGESGWVNVTLDGIKAKEVTITPHGEIYVDDELVGVLQIVDFENYAGLTRISNNLFKASDSEPIQIFEPVVLQGQLEESNVNPVQEMTNLINIQRRFESTQKVVRTIDDALQKAASKVGQYR